MSGNEEIKSIYDNILSWREQMLTTWTEIRIPSSWITSASTGWQTQHLPIVKGPRDSLSFFELAAKLHDAELYDQEAKNWWNFANAMEQAATSLNTTVDKITLELGKLELYFQKAMAAELKDIDQTQGALARLHHRVQQMDNEYKTTEQLQTDLKELQEANNKLAEELQKKELRSQTG